MSDTNRRQFLKGVLGKLALASGTTIVATTAASEAKPHGLLSNGTETPPDDFQGRADRLAANGNPTGEATEFEPAQFGRERFRNGGLGGFANGPLGGFRNTPIGTFRNGLLGGFRNTPLGTFANSPWPNGPIGGFQNFGWPNGGWVNGGFQNFGWPNGIWRNW